MAASQLAHSTHTKKLRYLDDLYQHADQLCGPSGLDNAQAELDDSMLAQILESWFVIIRNQPVVPVDVGHRIATLIPHVRNASLQVLRDRAYAEWRCFLDRLQLTHPTGTNKAAAAWTPFHKEMKAMLNSTSTTCKYSTYC
jgi:hypothetical protein